MQQILETISISIAWIIMPVFIQSQCGQHTKVLKGPNHI